MFKPEGLSARRVFWFFATGFYRNVGIIGEYIANGILLPGRDFVRHQGRCTDIVIYSGNIRVGTKQRVRGSRSIDVRAAQLFPLVSPMQLI